MVGSASSAVAAAQEETAPGAVRTPTGTARYHRGSLAIASFSPGMAPWVGARVGLGDGNEAGLIYSGRSLRLDGRHGFVQGHWALSAGLGGSAVLAQRGGSNSVDRLDVDGVNGWGFDVPVLFGWQSTASLVRLWAGARGGYERLGGKIGLNGADPVALSAGRVWGGGLVGLAMGFRHVYAALEMDGFFHHVTGSLGGVEHRMNGFTLAPGGALIGRF